MIIKHKSFFAIACVYAQVEIGKKFNGSLRKIAIFLNEEEGYPRKESNFDFLFTKTKDKIKARN